MERQLKFTAEGKRQLYLTRERVEAGDSSVFELSAQSLLFGNRGGFDYYRKVVIPKAVNLYNIHSEIFSRRARTPRIAGGTIFEMPVIVKDMHESVFISLIKEENYPGEI